jgi:hypothetical protein
MDAKGESAALEVGAALRSGDSQPDRHGVDDRSSILEADEDRQGARPETPISPEVPKLGARSDQHSDVTGPSAADEYQPL